MKKFIYLLIFLSISAAAYGATGTTVTYQVNGQPYEGYYITPAEQAPLVLLIHDWDGLTDYEVKRAGMLADLGYAVFALDLAERAERFHAGGASSCSDRPDLRIRGPERNQSPRAPAGDATSAIPEHHAALGGGTWHDDRDKARTVSAYRD